MSGIYTLLARCKFLNTPGMDEVLAKGRGVADGCKSGKSHKQGQRCSIYPAKSQQRP